MCWCREGRPATVRPGWFSQTAALSCGRCLVQFLNLPSAKHPYCNRRKQDVRNVMNHKSPVGQARGSFCMRGKNSDVDGDGEGACHGKIRDSTVVEPPTAGQKRHKAAQQQQEKQKQQVCRLYAAACRALWEKGGAPSGLGPALTYSDARSWAAHVGKRRPLN